MIPFARTVWSTSDGIDEANFCALWEGPAVGLGQFEIELHLDGEAIGSLQFTAGAQISDDGQIWTSAAYDGLPPATRTAADLDAHNHLAEGPFTLDDASRRHRYARVGLVIESASGTGIVCGGVSGTLSIFAPE